MFVAFDGIITTKIAEIFCLVNIQTDVNFNHPYQERNTYRHTGFIHEFYVLLTVQPCIISQINPTRCTILCNIFIYFASVHVSSIHVPIIRRKLLYLCDTGIYHSVWMASGLLVGVSLQPADLVGFICEMALYTFVVLTPS